MGHVAEQEGGLPLKWQWGSLELERGKRMARDLVGQREYAVCVLGGRGVAKLGLQRALLARTAEDREASGVVYVGPRPGAKVLGQDLGPICAAVRVGLGLGAKVACELTASKIWLGSTGGRRQGTGGVVSLPVAARVCMSRLSRCGAPLSGVACLLYD